MAAGIHDGGLEGAKVADTLDPLAMEETRSASGEDLFRAWPRYRAAVAGLRNYWYPVMFSTDLKMKPVARTVSAMSISPSSTKVS